MNKQMKVIVAAMLGCVVLPLAGLAQCAQANQTQCHTAGYSVDIEFRTYPCTVCPFPLFPNICFDTICITTCMVPVIDTDGFGPGCDTGATTGGTACLGPYNERSCSFTRIREDCLGADVVQAQLGWWNTYHPNSEQCGGG